MHALANREENAPGGCPVAPGGIREIARRSRQALAPHAAAICILAVAQGARDQEELPPVLAGLGRVEESRRDPQPPVGLWKVPVPATGREPERNKKSDQNRTVHRRSMGEARTPAVPPPPLHGPRARGDQPQRAPSGSGPPPGTPARGRGGRAPPEASLSIAPRRGDRPRPPGGRRDGPPRRGPPPRLPAGRRSPGALQRGWSRPGSPSRRPPSAGEVKDRASLHRGRSSPRGSRTVL